MSERVYTSSMRSPRAILAILLSLALFVQGVAASTMRSCHMRAATVAQSNSHSSHHHHDALDDAAAMTDMPMASHAHGEDAASAQHHDESDQSKTSKLTSCAWCAACCMNLALPVANAALPDRFTSARTVFPPIVVAPPSRLPSGWDRPPRA